MRRVGLLGQLNPLLCGTPAEIYLVGNAVVGCAFDCGLDWQVSGRDEVV